MDLPISFFIGVGLAAAAGFRVFIPLLAMSLFSYLGWFDPSSGWEWVGHSTTLIALSIAATIELAAYFIPWVDNILDSLTLPMATIAGTMLVAGSLTELEPLWQWAAAIIAGGGTAATIKGSTTGARLTSTATTAGLGNPVVSSVETGASILLAGLSFALPLLAFILALSVVFFLIWFYRKMFGRRKA